MIMIGFNHFRWSPEFKSLVRVAMGSSLALSIKFWLFRNDHDQIQPYSLKSWIWISCENCYGVKPDLVHQVLTFSKWSWSDSTIFFEVLNLNLKPHLVHQVLTFSKWSCSDSTIFFEVLNLNLLWQLLWFKRGLVHQVLTFSNWSWSELTIFFEVLNLNLLWEWSSLTLSIKFWLFWNDHDRIQPYSLKSWIWILSLT